MGQFLRVDMGPMNLISAPGALHQTRGALYLGNIPNAIELSKGYHKRFWAILNCTDDPDLDKLNARQGFEVIRLNQWDGEEYPEARIREGIKFIDEHMRSQSAVLVCCHAGISRSAGMVVAYLMSLEYSYNQAVSIVRKARPIIQIHPKIDLSIRKYFHLAPRTAADLIP